MRNQFVRFWGLSHTEHRLLLQAVIWLPVTHWGLQWLGFRRWRRITERLARTWGQPRQTEQASARVQQTASILGMAVRRGLYPGNCLSRSLTLWWLLRRQGIPSELRIGVRTGETGRFQAHAWIEYGGQPVNEKNDVRQRYATFEKAWLYNLEQFS